MKAREMPEKIYLFDYNDAMVTPLEGDTIYVREDAFIEKACFYIKNMVLDITYSDVDGKDNYKIDEFIEDFKKAMKDE